MGLMGLGGSLRLEFSGKLIDIRVKSLREI